VVPGINSRRNREALIDNHCGGPCRHDRATLPGLLAHGPIKKYDPSTELTKYLPQRCPTVIIFSMIDSQLACSDLYMTLR
jgi:hypothetical protein